MRDGGTHISVDNDASLLRSYALWTIKSSSSYQVSPACSRLNVTSQRASIFIIDLHIVI